MGRIAQFLGLQESAGPEAGELATAEYRLEKATESLARLELAFEDQGWMKLTAQMANEFSREGLRTAAELCRLMNIANPLIKRGLSIRAAYVFGQGMGISARATGESGEQDVNTLVQAFLDDPGNREAVTGGQARIRAEKTLGTDGNYFVAMFTSPLTGRVQARTIPFDEITDVINAPGDRSRPWYYLRQWVEVDESGQNTQMSAYYPALNYRPQTRARTYRGKPVYWDSPVRQVKVNDADGWSFGIGDAYAAVPWARAHKEFLEDWALMMKSLARITWQFSSKGKVDAQKKRAQIQSLANMPAGSMVNGSEGQTLEAVPKTGATLDSESSKPLASMAASALGISVIDLLADPGQTGARATAETLDTPKRLEMQGRQEVWLEFYRDILGYVIDQAVIAPRGPLKGSVERDGDRLRVTLAGDTDRTLDITYPDLDEVSLKDAMAAIVEADGTEKMPPLVTLRLMLRVLKVRDVDEILATVTDDQGNYIDPAVSAGDVAVKAFRDGTDPASALK